MSEKTEAKENNAKSTRPWLIGAAGLFTAMFVVYLMVALAMVIGGNGADIAAFGDAFGVFNAIFSGAAFVGVVITLFLQMSELKLQREELRLQRLELKQMSRIQADTLKMERDLQTAVYRPVNTLEIELKAMPENIISAFHGDMGRKADAGFNFAIYYRISIQMITETQHSEFISAVCRDNTDHMFIASHEETFDSIGPESKHITVYLGVHDNSDGTEFDEVRTCSFDLLYLSRAKEFRRSNFRVVSGKTYFIEDNPSKHGKVSA